MNTTLDKLAANSLKAPLTLLWPDGRQREFSHVQLRNACPCAACRYVRLTGGQVEAEDDVTVVNIAPAGYGVQFVFSDGHARGIYPWAYLETL
jgi:DUF971 family protein